MVIPAVLTVFMGTALGLSIALQQPGQTSAEQLFRRVRTSNEGAGPLANAQSCAVCHATPRLGGSGISRDAFVMLSPEEADPTGGHLFRQFLFRPGRAVVRRPPPARVFLRRPPSLLGLGSLEAVSVDAAAAQADPDDRNRDGASGRMPAGRFGWKARFPRLEHAVAAALVNELGLTNPMFPHDGGGGGPIEIGQTELRALTEFVRQLAPLVPRRPEPEGRAAFEAFGWVTCHVPSLPGLADGKPVEAFTDLLLHDMGLTGADVQEGNASSTEFRTAPLWGIAATGPPYLHDGRGATLDAAIRAHDGEGRTARIRYERASASRRAAVLRFLGSL